MRATLVRQVLSALAAALALTVLVFALIRLIPGDAITLWIGQEGSMPPQVQQTLRRMFGLTDPLYQQYLSWMGDLLRGEGARNKEEEHEEKEQFVHAPTIDATDRT